MPTLTVTEIVDQIARLQVNHPYQYVGSRSTLEIVRVVRPEGPITIRRNGQSETSNISREQLARIAFYCSARPDYPLHMDRLFSAGGNTRSALETLLAYTPHFEAGKISTSVLFID